MNKITKTDMEWQDLLTTEQYRITRKKETERPFSGEYYDCKEDGSYNCVCCGTKLFDSASKFDSGTGWPSFSVPAGENNIQKKIDNSLFLKRTEVLCSRCDAHLGHVFTDGPRSKKYPKGLRYCINSASLSFTKSNKT